LANVF